MDKIIVESVTIESGILSVKFSTTGNIGKFFAKTMEFWCRYSEDISMVPASIGVIPFVCNVLPIVWLANAELIVDSLDEDFYKSIPHIKKGYEDMFPNKEFNGKVSVKNIVKNQPPHLTNLESGVFFSGGVDAFCTLLNHIKESPALISLWGSDIKLTDTAGWDVVNTHISSTAKQYNLNYISVKTNFREFLLEIEAEALSSGSGDHYWHGFQHGIGIICHAAPLAYSMGLSTVYIASSYAAEDKGTYKCASDPTIDDMVRFCGTRVVHDGYEYNRQQKVDLICKKSYSATNKPILRVCWESSGGNNCCHCEKCLRTIFEILATGTNPADFGFNINPKEMTDSKNIVLATYRHFPVRVWLDTQQRLRLLPESTLPPWARWIHTTNFDRDCNSRKVSRYIERKQANKPAPSKIHMLFENLLDTILDK